MTSEIIILEPSLLETSFTHIRLLAKAKAENSFGFLNYNITPKIIWIMNDTILNKGCARRIVTF